MPGAAFFGLSGGANLHMVTVFLLESSQRLLFFGDLSRQSILEAGQGSGGRPSSKRRCCGGSLCIQFSFMDGYIGWILFSRTIQKKRKVKVYG